MLVRKHYAGLTLGLPRALLSRIVAGTGGGPEDHSNFNNLAPLAMLSFAQRGCRLIIAQHPRHCASSETSKAATGTIWSMWIAPDLNFSQFIPRENCCSR